MRSYDPDEIPEIDADAVQRASALGLKAISILCVEQDRDDDNGVQIVAFVEFVPRVGERIQLEDGTMCEVRRVYHRLVRQEGKLLTLMPNVLAVRIAKQ